MDARNFKITYVACTMFLLDRATVESSSYFFFLVKHMCTFKEYLNLRGY